MFAHKLDVELTSFALEDYRDILSYTINRWGHRQAEIYSEKINNALSVAAEFPLRGHVVEHDIRKIVVEKHRIFYRVQGDILSVLRILHERMDEAPYLS